jgi:DNA-binding MarR family transcriptional regulator
MHQLIATMERDRLIERRPDAANRRILRAWLTEHGSRILRACHRVVDDVEERMLSGLTPAEAVAFGRALEQCLDALTVPAGESADGEGAA